MQTASEIRAAVKNISYYSGRIIELNKQQFDADVELGNKVGVNEIAAATRFDCLGAIGQACTWVGVYCDNILANLETAEAQDKILHKSELGSKPEEVINENQEG